MSLSTQPYKGARDFYPEDKRIQKYMFEVMRRVVERYGYEEYDAPILEPIDLYLAKSGDEIVHEQTYVFEDRGGRTVTIRPEMTPTVSRMVAARRQELPYPLRWYSIPNLWRYERPQRGRLREHWQLNIDLFGLPGMQAEAEIVQVADAVLKAYGATHDMYTIKLNSRKLVEYVMTDYLHVTPVQGRTLVQLIDRKAKMEPSLFEAEADAIFTPTQREHGASNKLLGLLKIKQIAHLPEAVRNHPSIKDINELMSVLKDANIPNVEFDISLMRGFDYYTDIVFEVNDRHPDNNRSMFGGGRYDGLVGLFGVEPVPTVGFGMGDVTLQNFLEGHGLLPKLRSITDIYVIPIGVTPAKVQKLIASLRDMGLNVAVDLTDRKPALQIKTAVKKGIHYAMFIGEKELADEQYTLRNLVAGTEERHSTSRIVSIVKDYRTAEE